MHRCEHCKSALAGRHHFVAVYPESWGRQANVNPERVCSVACADQVRILVPGYWRFTSNTRAAAA